MGYIYILLFAYCDERTFGIDANANEIKVERAIPEQQEPGFEEKQYGVRGRGRGQLNVPGRHFSVQAAMVCS